MAAPAFEWNDSDGVWECGIRPERMPDLACQVCADDFDTLPTDAQHNAAYDIVGLSEEFVAEIMAAIETTLVAAADKDANLDDVTDPEFESVLIPRQRDDSNRFAFILFDSDIPCNIECVVVVRNGKDFRICDAKVAEIDYDWDDGRLSELFTAVR